MVTTTGDYFILLQCKTFLRGALYLGGKLSISIWVWEILLFKSTEWLLLMPFIFYVFMHIKMLI